MIENELVSIITANYNSEKYIVQTINSVLEQTYKNWEMIIVDDNSSDNSLEIIKKYSQSDDRIRFITQNINSGPAVTRNLGINSSKGRYITFLDSDDIWEKEFLELSVNTIKNNKDIFFTFSSYHRKNEDFSIDNGTFLVPKKVSYYDLLKTCPISCLTAMYDSKELGKVLMPKILKRQDYGLWLELLKKTNYAYGIERPLATYRMRDGSVSRNKFVAASYQWKIYREVEKMNIIKSIYYFLHYAYNGYKKYN